MHAAAWAERSLALHLRAVGAQVEHRDEASRPQRRPLDLERLGRLARLATALGHKIVRWPVLCHGVVHWPVPGWKRSTRVRPVAPRIRTANCPRLPRT